MGHGYAHYSFEEKFDGARHLNLSSKVKPEGNGFFTSANVKSSSKIKLKIMDLVLFLSDSFGITCDFRLVTLIMKCKNKFQTFVSYCV